MYPIFGFGFARGIIYAIYIREIICPQYFHKFLQQILGGKLLLVVIVMVKKKKKKNLSVKFKFELITTNHL